MIDAATAGIDREEIVARTCFRPDHNRHVHKACSLAPPCMPVAQFLYA
jgi:hypothetical protein